MAKEKKRQNINKEKRMENLSYKYLYRVIYRYKCNTTIEIQ